MRNENAIELIRIILNWKTSYFKLGELSGNEVSVIRAMLTRQGHDINMSELATMIGCGKSAASQLVGRLEDKGIVERYMAKEDRRVVYVRLTPGGEKMYASYKKSFEQFLERFIAEMGDADTEELTRLMKKSDTIFKKLTAEGGFDEINS